MLFVFSCCSIYFARLMHLCRFKLFCSYVLDNFSFKTLTQLWSEFSPVSKNSSQFGHYLGNLEHFFSRWVCKLSQFKNSVWTSQFIGHSFWHTWKCFKALLYVYSRGQMKHLNYKVSKMLRTFLSACCVFKFLTKQFGHSLFFFRYTVRHS